VKLWMEKLLREEGLNFVPLLKMENCDGSELYSLKANNVNALKIYCGLGDKEAARFHRMIRNDWCIMYPKDIMDMARNSVPQTVDRDFFLHEFPLPFDALESKSLSPYPSI